jgi:glycine/D-amino acid oxidase-like deaminating enzyme
MEAVIVGAGTFGASLAWWLMKSSSTSSQKHWAVPPAAADHKGRPARQRLTTNP